VVEEEEDVAGFEDYVAEDGGGAEEEAVAPSVVAPPAVVAAAEVDGTGMAKPSRDVEDAFALMPAARHLSQSRNVDATYLEGTGRGGRVTKGDVLAALANGVALPPWKDASAAAPVAPPVEKAAPAAPAPAPIVPGKVVIPTIATEGSYTTMRKIIAKRLTESKARVPRFYTSVEIELNEILILHKRLKSAHDV